MNRLNEKLPIVYLRPAKIFITYQAQVKPVRVITVLGSCVSVTLFNARMGMAAMCHGLMPRCPFEKPCDMANCPEPFKYVKCAVSDMISKFRNSGIRSGEIEVKLFGGAEMFRKNISDRISPSVGTMNVETALEVIRAERLQLIQSDVGGLAGRKIIFYPHNGEVLLKRLRSSFLKAV